MSKVQTMPLEIWTDINGNAARTQFKGGTKYIRADAQATVEAAISDRDKQQDISKALYQQVEALQRVIDDHHRLVRELDVSMNGVDGAAKQASLCDLVSQIQELQRERDFFETAAATANRMRVDTERALDAEREKVKGLEKACDDLRADLNERDIPPADQQLSQLQALVRALPVVEIDGVIVWAAPDESGWFVSKRPAPTGTYWAQFKTEEDAKSFLALLKYRDTLGENS